MRKLRTMWGHVLGAAAMFSLASPAGAFAIYTVGGDAACGYTSIQDAVDAAAANPGEDYVWVASNQPYTGQRVVIEDQDLDIEGGFVDCSDSDIDTMKTIVSGADNGGGPVFAFRGTVHVLMTNFDVRDAERDGDGGGIDFAATGGLTLQQSTISMNTADYGAGINFRGAGGHAALAIAHDTFVLRNTAATSGGGIRVEGDATLYMLEPNTLIAYNTAANGYGGGIEVIGPALANIGSPGYNGGGVIQFNNALRGGGLSVHAGNEPQSEGFARLFATDPQTPVQISNNFAALTGGGVYVQPNSIFDLGGYHPLSAGVCAQQFRIDDNIAQEGAAIYSDTAVFNAGLVYVGGSVELQTSLDGCGTTPLSLGAVACAEGVRCNTIDGNIAENANAEPTPGSTILMQNDGFLRIYGLHMHDNEGAHALRIFDTDADVRNALITDNAFGSDLFYVETEGDRGLVLRGSTIANNAIGGSVVHTGNDVELGNLIMTQPGVPAFSVSDFPQGFFEYLLASDTSGLPVRSDIVQGDATFVDVAARDYHLATGSLGLDFAPAAGSNDLDGRPRDVDLADMPNLFGPRDIGAYERQLGCAAADTIYCDGFDEA
jgi:predicted outer membrane repeat protein